MKIRGTAHHIGEKYLQLARDAQSSGDPVMAESYLQHAEHYFRLIAAAQQAQQQAQLGYQRQPGDQQAESEEEDADDDFAALPDRFASPSERQPQNPQPVPQPYGGQPFSDRQPYQPRQDNQERPDHRQDRQDRQDRYDQPRQHDRQQGDRQPYEQRDRPYDNRRDRNFQDRGGQDRGGQDRGGQDRGGQDRGDRQPRDYDNRGFRGRNRDGQPREVREPRQAPEEAGNGLPAFITGPSRAQQQDNDPQQADQPDTNIAQGGTGEEGDFQMRPRRRRRPKSEFAGEGGERGAGSQENRDVPATDPVGD